MRTTTVYIFILALAHKIFEHTCTPTPAGSRLNDRCERSPDDPGNRQ
jgi:hypothetical protein